MNDNDFFYLQMLEKDIADLPTVWVEQPDSVPDAAIIAEYVTLRNDFELEQLRVEFERASKYVRKFNEGDYGGDIRSQANKIEDLKHSIGVKQGELAKTKLHQEQMNAKQKNLKLDKQKEIDYKSWHANKRMAVLVNSLRKKLGVSKTQLVRRPNVQ